MSKTAYPKKIVNHYINQVKKKINVTKVILFGSFAYGKPNENSDVDLIVISPDFKKQEFTDRLIFLSRLRDKPTYQIAMDVIGYTNQEFNEIARYSEEGEKIKKESRVIYSS